VTAMVRALTLLIALVLVALCAGSAAAQTPPTDNLKPHVAAAAQEYDQQFPDITSVGGYNDEGSVPNSDHPKGLAIDLMTTDVPLGDAVSEYSIANVDRLGISYLIWNNRDWNPQAGWGPYTGPSPHTDHVHISFKPFGAGIPTVAPAAALSPRLPFTSAGEDDAPAPEYPGTGVVGQVDPPDEAQGRANAEAGTPAWIYRQLSYAGQKWYTYDLGVIPSPTVRGDTWFGNMFFDAAKFIVAATIAVNDTVLEGGLLDRLDDLIVVGTVTMYESVYTPLVPLVLLILALVLLLKVLRGELAVVAQRTAYALGALAVGSAAYLTPLAYVYVVDDALMGTSQAIRSGLLDAANVDGSDGLAETLHSQVVYDTWTAGQFGKEDSPAAVQHGQDLAVAQAFTRAEIRAGVQEDTGSALKQESYADIYDQLPPSSQQFFSGKASNRIGVGAFAVFEAVIYCSFQLVSSFAVFMAMLLFRLIVLLAPALAVIALIRHKTLADMFKATALAVFVALYLMLVASAHLMILVNVARWDISGFSAALLMLAVTVLLFWMTNPLRKMQSMATTGIAAAAAAPAWLPGARRVKADFTDEEATKVRSADSSRRQEWDRHETRQDNVHASPVRTEDRELVGAGVGAGPEPGTGRMDRARSVATDAWERSRTPLPDEDEQWRPMRLEETSRQDPAPADSPDSAGRQEPVPVDRSD